MAMFFWFLAFIGAVGGGTSLAYGLSYDKDTKPIAKWAALVTFLILFGLFSGFTSCIIANSGVK
jgi:hypothetical protein